MMASRYGKLSVYKKVKIKKEKQWKKPAWKKY